MSRYDRDGGRPSGPTRLYVGRLSSRTRTRDLEDLFVKYGRVRDVDLKHDFAFIEFYDSRDADDARHYLNGKEVDGSRLVVEFTRRVSQGPRGPGGAREYLGRGPPPGTGRCYNCGKDGHWARDCRAGDWRDKCYRCGRNGHIERNCRNSPRGKYAEGRRSLSRSRSPKGKSYSRSASRSRSRSYRSPSPDGRRVSRSPKSPEGKRARRSPSPEVRRSHRSLSENDAEDIRSRSRSLSPRDSRSPPPGSDQKPRDDEYDEKEKERDRDEDGEKEERDEYRLRGKEDDEKNHKQRDGDKDEEDEEDEVPPRKRFTRDEVEEDEDPPRQRLTRDEDEKEVVDDDSRVRHVDKGNGNENVGGDERLDDDMGVQHEDVKNEENDKRRDISEGPRDDDD